MPSSRGLSPHNEQHGRYRVLELLQEQLDTNPQQLSISRCLERMVSRNRPRSIPRRLCRWRVCHWLCSQHLLERRRGCRYVIMLRDSRQSKLIVYSEGYTSTAAKGLQTRLTAGSPQFAIHSRVLGNVLYMMSSVTSKSETLQTIEGLLREALLQ